ncbi:MAG: APC family permease [Propionibacteriaceae bacterium]|jgi:amino acid transporter|nr:APC family permease [Propionibacteriaceae bacterium]
MGTLKRILVGRPLASTQAGEQKLTRWKGLALLSSDALSSTAYGTEQIILALYLVSAAAFWHSLEIAAVVVVLLIALTASYRQIIHAYPHGGGAYVVTSENMGRTWGLVAAGSLLIDYMLTVAVSVSAGAEAITSAIPSLYGHEAAIACALIVVLAIVNLRGARESASVLVTPVFFFIAMMAVMIVAGLVQIITGQVPFNATSAIGTAVPGVTIFVLLRAFSSGSTSLTGVEAISNAVPSFKAPSARNAAATLTIMAVILGVFFAGVTFINYWYGIIPEHEVTLLSQIAAAVFGGNTTILFYLFQLATALILAVAANTGFSAFPQLSYNLARDKYMPHMFLARGDRLGYSNGILTLAAGAIVLIVVFHGIEVLIGQWSSQDTGGLTSLLIPLYAIGVFVPFTLAQASMVLRWKRLGETRWWLKAIPNAVGALISVAVVLVMIGLRFPSIWPYFLIMPVVVLFFRAIHRHYEAVRNQLRLPEDCAPTHYNGNTVVVLVSNVTRVDVRAVDYARSIGDEVRAFHVVIDGDGKAEEEIRDEFDATFPDIPLTIVRSQFRSIVAPALRHIDDVATEERARNRTVTVLVPQFITAKPWQQILHNQTSLRLRYLLNQRDRLVVATYTYRLND